MAAPRISRQMATLLQANASLLTFFTESTWAQRSNQTGIADFVVGNPHEAPLPAFTEALQRWSTPRSNDWFAYKHSEENAQATVAASLRKTHGTHFEPDDIFMTNGGAAAIAVALKAVVDQGDEVIFISPPWFFYETLITATGAVPVRVKIDGDSFDLDLQAVEAAISPRTRAVIINSPNNPTGKIYPPETLAGLASILADGSERNGRSIYLLSDEAYNKIVFDDRPFHSPTSFYPDSFLLYTYGKTLLTPGQRLGYIALPPSMPEREQLRTGIMVAQFVTGYAFPNALLQHALPDLEKLSINISHLERKRDRMVATLAEMGYQVHSPEGTFYLLPKSPWNDDMAFVDLLAERDVFVLPGQAVELPGYFRISLTASDEMIERGLPVFAAAIEHAHTTEPPQALPS